MPLEIAVTLQVEGDALQGSIDIPAQGAAGLPLQAIETEGPRIRFAIAGVPGDPTFDGVLSEGRIEGSFTQSGATLPFVLVREGGEPSEGGQQDVYTDPEGRFRVTVPQVGRSRRLRGMWR